MSSLTVLRTPPSRPSTPAARPVPAPSVPARHPAGRPSPLADLCRGARAREPQAVARLGAIVTRILAPHLRDRPPAERGCAGHEVLESVLAELRRRPVLPSADGLLDQIERACARWTGGDSRGRASSGWLRKLSGVLSELGAPEREVLQGLYLDHQSPTELAGHLGLSLAEVHELRHRGLRTLRGRLELS